MEVEWKCEGMYVCPEGEETGNTLKETQEQQE